MKWGSSGQGDKKYEEFNTVISAWINLNPPKRFRNTIIVSEINSSELKINGQKFHKEVIKEYESPFNLIQIVEINVGGPEYDNFNGIIKFLYNLLHGKKEEINEFFKTKGNLEFDINEVLNPMEEYISFDEQTKNLYKAEGISEGIKIGISEGKKEGIAEFKEKLKQELQGIDIPEEIKDLLIQKFNLI